MKPRSDSNVRKLTRSGAGRSMGVIIPIDIIRALGWRERQKVRVVQKGSKVVIEDWKG